MSLLEADDQRGDWYGWATNQAGHAAVIGQPAALVLWWLGVPALIVMAVVWAVYLAVWEIWVQGMPDWRDSVMDAANVAAGASVMVLALGGDVVGCACALAVWGKLLWFGVRRRL
jgi:hypothetical protein